jgi:hypothetical protein
MRDWWALARPRETSGARRWNERKPVGRLPDQGPVYSDPTRIHCSDSQPESYALRFPSSNGLFQGGHVDGSANPFEIVIPARYLPGRADPLTHLSSHNLCQ